MKNNCVNNYKKAGSKYIASTLLSPQSWIPLEELWLLANHLYKQGKKQSITLHDSYVYQKLGNRRTLDYMQWYIGIQWIVCYVNTTKSKFINIYLYPKTHLWNLHCEPSMKSTLPNDPEYVWHPDPIQPWPICVPDVSVAIFSQYFTCNDIFQSLGYMKCSCRLNKKLELRNVPFLSLRAMKN